MFKPIWDQGCVSLSILGGYFLYILRGKNPPKLFNETYSKPQKNNANVKLSQQRLLVTISHLSTCNTGYNGQNDG